MPLTDTTMGLQIKKASVRMGFLFGIVPTDLQTIPGLFVAHQNMIPIAKDTLCISQRTNKEKSSCYKTTMLHCHRLAFTVVESGQERQNSS